MWRPSKWQSTTAFSRNYGSDIAETYPNYGEDRPLVTGPFPFEYTIAAGVVGPIFSAGALGAGLKERVAKTAFMGLNLHCGTTSFRAALGGGGGERYKKSTSKELTQQKIAHNVSLVARYVGLAAVRGSVMRKINWGDDSLANLAKSCADSGATTKAAYDLTREAIEQKLDAAVPKLLEIFGVTALVQEACGKDDNEKDAMYFTKKLFDNKQLDESLEG